MRFSYIFKRLFHMNYGQMLRKINSIHKKTGMGRVKIFMDMKDCAVKYGAGYMDYDLFEMYNLTDEQRDTYITRGRNNELVKQYNDLSYSHFFDNKDEFNTRFADYINRDWVIFGQDNKEQVLEFIKTHSPFIFKPIGGMCGKGIQKLRTEDFESLEACYDYMMDQEGDFELEQVIQQHPAVSAIYPHAINTVRAVTIFKDGKAHLVCTYFRIGNGGRPVDNFNSGGMVTPVDEVTGIVLQPAIDKNKVLYENHPMTGTPIKGFQFPDWDKVMEMVKKAAAEVPQMGYLGWDVAFTPDGPCLVEGNHFCGHDIYQLPEHTPDKIGIMPKFRV